MKVSKEELLHIAKLSDLKLEDNEVEKYLESLDDILNFADVINNAPIDGLKETIGANDNYNVFRKDEIVTFENKEDLLKNAPEKERDMFKIPKVM